MMNDKLVVHQMSVGPLQVNCFIASCSMTKEAVVIDPGEEGERILHVAEKQGL